MRDGVVIIGAGHAGVQAAASLREEGYDGPVTLVGDEDELPYHKPPLSKTFIKDLEARPQILRAEQFYTGASIALRLGSKVEAIDLPGRRVTLAGGGHMPFERLILATGSRPRDFAFPGVEPGAKPDGIVSLRSAADARLIRIAASGAQDVVVVGGGFIGLEMAAVFAAAGKRVTVIEAQERLLSRAVAPQLSTHVGARLVAAGVRIMTSTTVSRLLAEAGRVTGIETSSGERIAAQMVVIGVGVVPNSELAAAAGIATANGIRVDASLRTTAPEVLAIGDAASFRHWATGTELRLESVQNATDQARLAARTIVGHQGDYGAVPWFWSDIGDMKLQMAGLTLGGDRRIVAGEPDENRFSVYHFAGPRLIAVESVNRPGDHMLGRRMIAAGFSPDEATVAAGADALKAAFAAATPAASTRP